MAADKDKIPVWKVNKRKYINEYNKTNMKDVILHLHKTNDADIIQMLSIVPNKNGYIKSLIRQDIKNLTSGMIPDKP